MHDRLLSKPVWPLMLNRAFDDVRPFEQPAPVSCLWKDMRVMTNTIHLLLPFDWLRGPILHAFDPFDAICESS